MFIDAFTYIYAIHLRLKSRSILALRISCTINFFIQTVLPTLLGPFIIYIFRFKFRHLSFKEKGVFIYFNKIPIPTNKFNPLCPPRIHTSYIFKSYHLIILILCSTLHEYVSFCVVCYIKYTIHSVSSYCNAFSIAFRSNNNTFFSFASFTILSVKPDFENNAKCSFLLSLFH